MTRVLLFALLAFSRCKGDPNPHRDLVATEAAQLTPANTLCAGSSDPDCEAKDEDGALLVAEDGTFYLTWMSNRDANDEVYLMRSADGVTWEEPVRVTSHPDGDWYPTLVEYETENARFHLVWMRQEASGAYARHIYYNSSADGVTWDTANERALTTGLVDDFVPYIVEHNDNLLVYFDNGTGLTTSGTHDLFVVRSTDGGATWGEPTEAAGINSATEDDSFPFVAQRPFSNDLTMVWVRYATGTIYVDATADLFFATSQDGITWSGNFTVNTDIPDTTVDTIPSFYGAGLETYFTWLQGVGVGAGVEPHIVEFPMSGSLEGTYPDGLVDVTESNGVPGWSPRVVPTLKQGLYLRVWVSEDKKVYSQFFER